MSEPAKLTESKTNSRILWWIRESAAYCLWVFIFVKVLVYDVDVAVVRMLPPQAEALLRFKFFVILGIIALLWLILGNRRFFKSVAYVLFFPVVVLLWKIPRLLFTNWVLLLVFSPAIHSLVTSFRMSFIFTVGALLASLAIVLSNSRLALIPAMIFLAFYLCRHGAKKIKMAFQPASVFANIANIIRQLWVSYEQKTLPGQVQIESKLDPSSEAYGEKTLEHLNSLYLVNSIFQGILFKLKQSGVSRKLDIYFISSLLYAALLTVIVFGFQFLALEKIQPGSFGVSPSPGFWDFLGLSFSTLMTAGLSPLVPKSTAALIIAHSELVVALLLLVILVFVILTISREKFREDAEQAIAELKKGAEVLEKHISEHYKLSIEDAERKLIIKHGQMINALRKFRGLTVIEIPLASPKPEQKPGSPTGEVK